MLQPLQYFLSFLMGLLALHNTICFVEWEANLFDMVRLVWQTQEVLLLWARKAWLYPMLFANCGGQTGG